MSTSLQLDNLNVTFEQADEDTVEKGYDWYLEAHRELFEISIEYDKPITQVAAICSKISPGIKWTNNLRGVRELYSTGITRQGYSQNIIVALQIKNGEYGDTFTSISECFSTRAKKTMNFYGNLCYPLSNEYVTVDRWIYRVVTSSDVELTYIKSHQNQAISNRIKEIAKEKKIIPNMVQAVIWEQIRKKQTV